MVEAEKGIDPKRHGVHVIVPISGRKSTLAVLAEDPNPATLRFRKEEELIKGIRALSGRDRVESGEVKLLTSCPACQQGLAKYADSTGLKTDYILIELANRRLGAGWQKRFIEQIKGEGIERVLL